MNTKGVALANALEIAVDALCPGDKDGTWDEAAVAMLASLKLQGWTVAPANWLDALREAQPHVCGLLCPSAKKTGEEWTHVALCERLTTLSAAPDPVRPK